MLKRKRLAIIAASAVALTGFAVIAPAPAASSSTSLAIETPYEDEPAWNCYTHGNGSCGKDLKRVKRSDGVRGVVLSAANDGKVYVSWKDGKVTRATKKQRKAAWRKCIATSEPSDANLRACDESFAAKKSWRY
jgi:hypothetical protein